MSQEITLLEILAYVFGILFAFSVFIPLIALRVLLEGRSGLRQQLRRLPRSLFMLWYLEFRRIFPPQTVSAGGRLGKDNARRGAADNEWKTNNRMEMAEDAGIRGRSFVDGNRANPEPSIGSKAPRCAGLLCL